MTSGVRTGGIVAQRLQRGQYEKNFADLHPVLSRHEAQVAADRCYFCFEAPCQTACPTEIDIALFIREIATDNPLGAAKTIFEQNILGGMCARVCPTETLCEQACVREEAEGKPVKIGQLQRYATDIAMESGMQFAARANATGKKVAVVGAGPAGLACAHRLAIYGHEVVIFDAHEKPGGLSEYGIAAYKTVDDFAQREVEYILGIGGIEIENDNTLGRDFTLDQLSGEFDGVFLGLGLAGANALRIEGEQAIGVRDAIDFIAELRQAKDKSRIAIGRNVVIIGGGMTAIDMAIQAKLLGAENVTLCYRRGQEFMNASTYEQELAAAHGVIIRHWLAPTKILVQDGKASSIELEYTRLDDGKLVGTGENIALVSDQVFKAIGQNFDIDLLSDIEFVQGRIKISPDMRTSRDGVWAGGDCAAGGDDLTVTAVAHGRDAAESMHKQISAG